MKSAYFVLRFVFIVGTAMLLTGCLFKAATVPTRHFVLASIPSKEIAPAEKGHLGVGIGSVNMPSYLLRDSMAVRNGANEIEFIENALWAERLDHSFQQALAANLSALLPSDQVYRSAWSPDQVKVTAVIKIEQFDVDLQGQGTLVAWWRINALNENAPLKSGETRLVQNGPPPRGNPQAIATTLSTLTGQFSRELAQAIREAAPAKP